MTVRSQWKIDFRVQNKRAGTPAVPEAGTPAVPEAGTPAVPARRQCESKDEDKARQTNSSWRVANRLCGCVGLFNDRRGKVQVSRAWL